MRRLAQELPSPEATGQYPVVYVRKGAAVDKDAYSGFEGQDEQGRPLDEILKSRGVKRIFVAGLATDYCVRATVLAGLKHGYEV